MWESFLSFLFPKKCINCKRFGDYLCDECFSKINFNEIYQCPECRRPTVNGITHPICQKKYGLRGVIPVVVYGKISKKLIYQLKYSPNLKILAKIIADLMIEGLAQNESFYSEITRKDYVIVPVPLSKGRYRKRGYNHAELIASHVAQYFELNLRSDILIRIRDTKPQYKLNKHERVLNIRGAFSIENGAEVAENIILLDDIATSYSTLKECAKVLKMKGAKRVLGVTFAKEA